jgi:hypothetical protein
MKLSAGVRKQGNHRRGVNRRFAMRRVQPIFTLIGFSSDEFRQARCQNAYWPGGILSSTHPDKSGALSTGRDNFATRRLLRHFDVVPHVSATKNLWVYYAPG